MTVTAEQLNATHIDAENSELRQIPVNSIIRNPENPRILFRQGELEQLLESIRLYGVQVPISVYRQGQKFVLIDGERRWKCALKLNKKTIPALIQERPTPLTNLLLMFNIHALREQWDLFTIAMKLPRVIALLEEKLRAKPNERQIANETGLARSVIRRSKLLIELPDHYKEMILSELNKPKSKQKLTEDLFIELERALKTVDRYIPGLIRDKNEVRDVLIKKYQTGLIPNIIYFRQIPKIARAESVEVDKGQARLVLTKLFRKNDYSIEEAYQESVSEAYLERDLITRIDSLLKQLTQYQHEVDQELKNHLILLVDQAQRILEATE